MIRALCISGIVGLAAIVAGCDPGPIYTPPMTPAVGTWVTAKNASVPACGSNNELRLYYQQQFSSAENQVARFWLDANGCGFLDPNSKYIVIKRYFPQICVRRFDRIDCRWVMDDNVVEVKDDSKCDQPAGHGMNYPECEPPRKAPS